MDVQSLKIDRGPSASKSKTKRSSRRGRSPWLGRGIGLVVIAGIAWTLRGPIQRGLDQLNLPRVELHRVKPSRASDASAMQGAAANGYVVAARRAALSADTPGRIVELNVTEGSVVKKDDVVARLFSEEYAAAVEQAEAIVATASAQVKAGEATKRSREVAVLQRERTLEAAGNDVAEATANTRLAQQRLKRTVELVEQQIASQDDLDAAQNQLEAAEAREAASRARQAVADVSVEDAKAAVEQAAADLAVAKARVVEARAAAAGAQATLDKTEVRAPFDGIVVLKDAEVGEVVSPNSQGGSNARGSICTMVDFDSLEIQADVPETSLSAVTVGGAVRVFPDAFPGVVLAGKVDRIWPTADRQKATIEVRARLDKRSDVLRPEMGVRLVFVDGETASESAAEPAAKPAARTEALLVPLSTLVRGADGADGVFLFDRGRVIFRTVQVESRDARRASIGSGLSAGDRIVLDPPADLTDGDRVLIADDS